MYKREVVSLEIITILIKDLISTWLFEMLEIAIKPSPNRTYSSSMIP